MSEPDAPPDTSTVEARFVHDDDAASTEARIDAHATATFYATLIRHGVPEELAGELCREWQSSYLDQCGPPDLFDTD